MKHVGTKPKQNKIQRQHGNSTWGKVGERLGYQNLEAGRRALGPKCLGVGGTGQPELVFLWKHNGTNPESVGKTNKQINWKLE